MSGERPSSWFWFGLGAALLLALLGLLGWQLWELAPALPGVPEP